MRTSSLSGAESKGSAYARLAWEEKPDEQEIADQRARKRKAAERARGQLQESKQPRELLRHISADYVDMTPNRSENYCCGGGGGTVSIDEIRSFRTRIGGATKAEQIKRTGATYLVAPCANCKKQLREVCNYRSTTCERHTRRRDNPSPISD